jgi:hypothetical protein
MKKAGPGPAISLNGNRLIWGPPAPGSSHKRSECFSLALQEVAVVNVKFL